MLTILQTSSSALKVNQNQTSVFKHKSGLRQGDPLLPLLFILIEDSLHRFLTNVVPLMPQHIFFAPETIQFTYDTIIIAQGHSRTLQIITKILEAYSNLTGLKINQNKSTFVLVAIPEPLIRTIETILGSPPSNLPIKYLGFLLTIKKPRKVHFEPMLQAIRSRLEGWTVNFLSYGGRLTLIKSVLPAIPLHYMQVLRIPKVVFKHIDKMRRNFLQKENDICRGMNCLVNQEMVSSLKSHGGLRIIDLGCKNEALLTSGYG